MPFTALLSCLVFIFSYMHDTDPFSLLFPLPEMLFFSPYDLPHDYFLLSGGWLVPLESSNVSVLFLLQALCRITRHSPTAFQNVIEKVGLTSVINSLEIGRAHV